MWQKYLQRVFKRALMETCRDATGSSWPNRIVQAMLVMVPLAYAIAWRQIRPNAVSSSAVESAAFTALSAVAALITILALFFLWHLIAAVPYRLWREESSRAENLDLELRSLADVRVQLQQCRKAVERGVTETADCKHRLKEIRPYLEMLEAEHKLAEFDNACPPIEIPIPPKPSGDLESDRNRWAMFAEGVRELTKSPQYNMGMHGLKVLSDEALARIHDAGRKASMAHRKREDAVEWAGHEPIRMDWLILAARLDQLRIEQENEKDRLSVLSKELTRAQKVEEILRLLPKVSE